MSKVLQSVKNLFRRNNRNLPPYSYPNHLENVDVDDTIRPPAPLDDEEFSDDGRNSQNYNVPEHTREKEKQRNMNQTSGLHGANTNMNSLGNFNLNQRPLPLVNTALPFVSESLNSGPTKYDSNTKPTNNSSSSFGGFPPGMNPNKSASPTTNNPAPSFSGFPPGMNPNQSTTPVINNPAPSFSGFPPGMNPNKLASPATSNPAPSFGGFPPGMNPNQSTTRATSNPAPSFGGFPPGMNPNQSTTSATNNPAPSFSGFPPGMNPNKSASPTTNNPAPSFSGFPPGMNPNQSPAPPASNPSAVPTGFPPVINLTQPQTPQQPRPASPATTSSSFFGKFLPGLNNNKSSNSPTSTTNPKPTFTDFSTNINSQSVPSTQVPPNNDPNQAANNQLKPIIKRTPSNSNQQASDDNGDDNLSRLELDFPIENVLVDTNIPSSMAIKINEAVERDRLGNAYHIDHYTFEPPIQRISIGNDQKITRRLTGNTFPGGTRHITEIENFNPNALVDTIEPSHQLSHQVQQNHSRSNSSLNQYVDQLMHTPGSTVIQAQNFQHLQDLLNQYISSNAFVATQPTSINSYPSETNFLNEPYFYYTARALPNDPMRQY